MIVAANDSTRFPGVTEISSPDGKYVVRNQDREDGHPYHTLFLVDTIQETERILLQYVRNVEVLWAPDSKSLFINDYQGSDESTCYVLDDRATELIDVRQRLSKENSLKTHLARNHHVYVSCESWVTGKILSISASGYGDYDQTGFDIRVEYDLDGDVVSVR